MEVVGVGEVDGAYDEVQDRKCQPQGVAPQRPSDQARGALPSLRGKAVLSEPWLAHARGLPHRFRKVIHPARSAGLVRAGLPRYKGVPRRATNTERTGTSG